MPQGPITCGSLSSLCEQQKAWKHQGWAGQAAIVISPGKQHVVLHPDTHTHTDTVLHKSCVASDRRRRHDADKKFAQPANCSTDCSGLHSPPSFPATPWQLPVRGIDEMLSSCYDWTKMDTDTSWTRTGAGEVWRNTNALMTTPGAKEHIKF